MRYSKQREALIQLLRSTTSHPDAEWLYTGLRKDFPNISLGTVYRNLNALSESNQILKITIPNDSVHYDNIYQKHDHLHCLKCQQTMIMVEGECLNFDEINCKENNINATEKMLKA